MKKRGPTLPPQKRGGSTQLAKRATLPAKPTPARAWSIVAEELLCILPLASEKATAGKPALLRIITRFFGRLPIAAALATQQGEAEPEILFMSNPKYSDEKRQALFAAAAIKPHSDHLGRMLRMEK